MCDMTGDDAGCTLEVDRPSLKRARLLDDIAQDDDNTCQPRALHCDICRAEEIQTTTLTCTVLSAGDNTYTLTLKNTNRLLVQDNTPTGYGMIHCGNLDCSSLTVGDEPLDSIIQAQIANTNTNTTGDNLTLQQLQLGTNGTIVQTGGLWDTDYRAVVWTHNVTDYTFTDNNNQNQLRGMGTLFTINPAYTGQTEELTSEFAAVYLSCDEYKTRANSYAFQIVHPHCNPLMLPTSYHGQLRIGSVVCSEESHIGGLKITGLNLSPDNEQANVILTHRLRNYGWLFDNYPANPTDPLTYDFKSQNLP